MVLAVVRQWRREGRQPPRDVVLAFLADEEAGGRLGARWLVDNHPDLFEGCTEAVSEVGGFSMTFDGRRFYMVETAQKGLAWMRLTARGRAGHGSLVNHDNAVTTLCEAVARLGGHVWPVRPTKTVQAFFDVLGIEFDPAAPEQAMHRLGIMASIVGATLRNTTNPSMLQAGYKTNVIPQTATAQVDGRFLPGYEEEFFATVDELLGPGIEREMVVHDVALETEADGPLWEAMVAALRAEDPDARIAPYCLPAGTDNKSFARLGIRGFGFSPLRLPADLDFPAMFHGVDERVPVEALHFGVRVLDRFLAAC
jgi:acetylornithine deacetylase/succinyl-diaminopimelate desuccinylase-like protein